MFGLSDVLRNYAQQIAFFRTLKDFERESPSDSQMLRVV
jgi:hypothetical protein